VVKKLLELASYLKVDTVLVIPGAVDVFFDPSAEIVPYDIAYQRACESLRDCLKTAEKYRVKIPAQSLRV